MKCIICGARVRNHNPKCVTCDPVCTAAKKSGRTREGQLKHEMAHPPADDGIFCPGCGFFTSQCQCWDAVNHQV